VRAAIRWLTTACSPNQVKMPVQGCNNSLLLNKQLVKELTLVPQTSRWPVVVTPPMPELLQGGAAIHWENTCRSLNPVKIPIWGHSNCLLFHKQLVLGMPLASKTSRMVKPGNEKIPLQTQLIILKCPSAAQVPSLKLVLSGASAGSFTDLIPLVM